MKEIVSGMRVIKMYAWEAPFSEMVNKIRRLELSLIPTLICKFLSIIYELKYFLQVGSQRFA